MKKIIALLGLTALIVTGCKKDDPTYTLKTLTFEEVPAAALAGPTAKGENLYSTYGTGQFTAYTDAATGLSWEINESGATREFWNGGIAASRWKNKEVAGQDNQCSVYGDGGNNGSATFAVATGLKNIYGGEVSSLRFGGSTEKVVDHLYVSNTTYAALVMKNGNASGKKLTYEAKDWFRLTITGFDAAGTSTGKVEFYLADFRTASAGGIVEGWKKVDLAALGNVNKLAFSFDGSDSGDYGLNTPAYVCLDDIAVRQ